MYFLHRLFLSFSVITFSTNTLYVSSKELRNGEITDDTLKKLMIFFNEFIGDSQLLPDQSIMINNTMVFLNGDMKNGTILFNNFKVAFAHVNMKNLEFHTGITYSSINLIGDYSLYVDNEWVHAESADAFSINTTDLSTDINLKLNLTKENTLQIENIIVDYNATVKVNFKNLGGFQDVSDTLNKLINHLIPDSITSTKSQVQEEIKKKGMQMGNDFIFKDMTVDKFIEDINNLVNNENILN